MRTLMMTAALACVLGYSYVSAQVPQTMSYQGVLVDANGTPVPDGNYDLHFKLYTTVSGGSAIWSESQNAAVVRGVFSVTLGSSAPLAPAFDQPYWLGIAVGTGAELTPRVELTSTAYSLTARSVTDSAITSGKLAAHTVVRSLNGLSDQIHVKGGDNIVVTTAGDSLVISGAAAIGNTLDQAYDQGGAGAGRVITADAGAFEVGGVDGALFTGTFGSGVIPVTGAGTRLMWFPNKSAFRVGSVTGNHWDHDSIGSYSMASGYNTKASGFYSTALGGGTTASGGTSTAMGSSTIASGFRSTALGRLAKASGSHSMAMGTNIEAAGNYSLAIGLSDQGGLQLIQDSTMAIMGGRVGIGTVSPRSALELGGAFGISGTSYLPDQTNFGLFMSGYDGSTDIGRLYVGDNTGWKFHFSSRFGGVDTDLLTIQDNGRVGIGVTSPSNKLHVNGVVYSSSGGFKFPDGTVQTTAASGGGEGDITGVTAGTGLSGGGLSGDVTLMLDTSLVDGRFVNEGQINSVTGGMIQSGQLVRAVNNLKDNVQIKAGNNIAIATAGDSVVISAVGVGAGDITGVAAGTGLAGGGLSGDVTLRLDTTYADGRFVNENQVNSVDSNMIKDGSVTNNDIRTAAGISGSKVDPNFGSQNILTNGTLTVNGINGVLFTGTYGSGTIPVTGAGIRAMWYPNKAAFRVGRVTGNHWDNDSVGNYSFSAGFDTRAKGTSSVATGDRTAAIGDYSTAMGRDTWAGGSFSTAMGRTTTASGYASTSMGNTTTASGHSSTALGYNTVASNSYSTAIGHSTTASGLYSTAMGRGITAQGNYSFAIALSDQTGEHVYGDSTMAIMGGKVGIGTTAPTTDLAVEGGFRIHKNNVTITSDGNTITLKASTATITIDQSGTITIGSTGGDITIDAHYHDLHLAGNDVNIDAHNNVNVNGAKVLLNATTSSPGAARLGDSVLTPLPSPVGVITGASGSVLIGN